MQVWNRAWPLGQAALKEGREEWVWAPFKVFNLTWGPQGIPHGLNLGRGSKEGEVEIWSAEVTEFLEIRAFVLKETEELLKKCDIIPIW